MTAAAGTFDHEVAIVGGGPVGIALANWLGMRGIGVAVFEREAGIYPLPRAIHLDGEVMRILETLGLRPAVETIARPGLKGMHFVNAAGETLLIRGGTAERGLHGCANNYYFHQPDLEAVLREGLARFAGARLYSQHVVEQIETLPAGGARLWVSDAGTGRSQARTARFVVGCDGARSLLRRVVGAMMNDLGLHQPWLVFDVELLREVPQLPDHTVQHCNPARPMTFCNVTGQRRRWEIMLMPGDDPQQIVRPENIWPLVARWMGPADARIERAVIYTFHSVIAQGWRRGPLLLAGDAAHQTPPFLGQGLCAGLRDVANLAWKLEAVLRGRADERLLDTYESERAPHVHAFIELAVRLGGIIQATDPAAARERDRRLAADDPQVFEFPAPRLGPGVWAADDAAAGRIFGQPRAIDGRGLDAHAGAGMALLADPAWLASRPDTAAELGRWHDGVVIPATTAEMRSSLQAIGAPAVLLRPDRYIAGVVNESADVERLGRLLHRQPQPA